MHNFRGYAENNIPLGFCVVDHTNNVEIKTLKGRQEFYLGFYSLLDNNGVALKLIIISINGPSLIMLQLIFKLKTLFNFL